MASLAITKLVEKARSVQGSLARLRDENKKTEQRTIGAVCQLAGGAVGGVLDGKYGGGETHEVFGMPSALTGGAVLAAVGIMDLIPGAEYVANVGLGAASYGLGNLIKGRITPT